VNDGGPAFPSDKPVKFYSDGSTAARAEGMSLRDWFAGQALGGMAGYSLSRDESAGSVASLAYFVADAMLKAREEQR